MFDMNNIRATLLDLEQKDTRTLELVGSFLANLDIDEAAKYSLWSEWLSYTGTAEQDTVYEYSKSLAPVTLEDLEEAAAEATAASIMNTDDSLASFEVSELNFTTPKAVAKQFIKMYNKPLKYVADLDIWLEWTGTHWQPVEEVFLMNVLSNATDRIFNRHEKIDQYETKDLKAFSRTYNKVAGLKEVLRTLQAQAEIEVVSKELDNEPNIIGCLNGAVDLTTGLLVASKPEQYLTKSTGLYYDPTATCEVWQKTINDVFLDDAEMISFFKTLIGYSVLGHNKEHLFCFMIGSGANGKSTIVNALSDVFGDYGKSTQYSTLSVNSKGSQHREDLVRLQGARMVHTSEPNADSPINEGMVKDISGGDTVIARTAYARKSVEITPKWLTIVPTNHTPKIKSDDDGIWRRMLFVPFKRNFKLEPDLIDLDLPEKLSNEKEGILRWVVEGALDYQANGLVIPEALKNDKAEYRAELDLVGNWIAEKCSTGEGYRESNQNLWASFNAYVKAKGYETDIKSSQKLSNNINSKGFTRASRDNTGIRGFLGIKVN